VLARPGGGGCPVPSALPRANCRRASSWPAGAFVYCRLFPLP
jgi:hypothetical protein